MDEVLRRHNTSFDEVVHLTTDVLKISARIVFSVGTDALRTRIGDLNPPAYIRLMCGALHVPTDVAESLFFGGTTSVPGSDQRKLPEMFVKEPRGSAVHSTWPLVPKFFGRRCPKDQSG
jgi:hypothetical protein